MLLCLPETYREKLAKSLYVINKEAKRLRDLSWSTSKEWDRDKCIEEKDRLYSLKNRVISRLDDMGEIDAISYHILYYKDDEDEFPVYGVLYQLGNFTYHQMEDDLDWIRYQYGNIPCLGEIDSTISSKLDKTKSFSDNDVTVGLPTVTEAKELLTNFCKKGREFFAEFYEETDELYAQFGL